jgi:hypothetical protein
LNLWAFGKEYNIFDGEVLWGALQISTQLERVTDIRSICVSFYKNKKFRINYLPIKNKMKLVNII